MLTIVLFWDFWTSELIKINKKKVMILWALPQSPLSCRERRLTVVFRDGGGRRNQSFEKQNNKGQAA